MSGAIAGVDYSIWLANGAYTDPSNPTPDEIQAVVDEANTVLGRAAVVADLAGGVSVTATQINGITGISGAVTGTSYSAALAAAQSTFGDSNNPSAAEVQAVVTAVNLQVGLASVSYDIVVPPAATVSDINGIDGVSGAVSGVDYATWFARATYTDPISPTPQELMGVVAAANNDAGLQAVVEDINGNADNQPATAATINMITGVTGAVLGTDYSTQLARHEYGTRGSPTLSEIQSVVDTVNNAAGLASVTDDANGNRNGISATPAQINGIVGVSGAIEGGDYTAAFQAALQEGKFDDPGNPTALEIQGVVDAANAAYASIVDDVTGNNNGAPATADDINSLGGVSGAVDGVNYAQGLFDGIFADAAKPTAAEIQSVVREVNTALGIVTVIENSNDATDVPLVGVSRCSYHVQCLSGYCDTATESCTDTKTGWQSMCRRCRL